MENVAGCSRLVDNEKFNNKTIGKNMKTLADFKRAMQVGTVLKRKHVNEAGESLRTVSRVKSNGIWLLAENGKEAFLGFPKASEFEINGDGEAEIYWPPTYTYEGVDRVEIPRRLVLTYKLA